MSSQGFSRGEVIFGLSLLCAGAVVLTAAGENVTRAASDADAASDLRGLAAAGMRYAADQNGLLPPFNPKELTTGEVAAWHAKTTKVATLWPYFEDPSILTNISDRQNVIKDQNHNDYPSYGMNNRVGRHRVLELSQVRTPERMVWFAESGHKANGERKPKGSESFVINPSRPRDESGVFARRDGVAAFVVYFNGRVELIENTFDSEVASPTLAKNPKAALAAHWEL